MRVAYLFSCVLIAALMIVTVNGAAQRQTHRPLSLGDAGIRMSANLLGAGIGPYGMEQVDQRRPVIYQGEPVQLIVVMRHGGSYELSIFREDGKLKEQLAVSLRQREKVKNCDIEAVAEPTRMDNRGRRLSGLGSLGPGESLQSLWKLTSEPEPGDYELIVRFAAAGEVKGDDAWEREIRPIKLTIKKAESETDKLNVLFRKGAAFFDEGKTDEAIVELKNLLSVHPNCAFAYEYLGHCHRDREDREEAVKMYEKAMQIVRDDKDEKIKLSKYEKGNWLAFLRSIRNAAESDK